MILQNVNKFDLHYNILVKQEQKRRKKFSLPKYPGRFLVLHGSLQTGTFTEKSSFFTALQVGNPRPKATAGESLLLYHSGYKGSHPKGGRQGERASQGGQTHFCSDPLW